MVGDFRLHTAQVMSTRIERDSMGEDGGAGGSVLGRADPALPGELQDRHGAPARAR